MMKVVLKDQVEINVLSYIDDIVVTSKKKDTYIYNLAKTFTNMCEVRLKHNPEKCIFGITRGKVLGCLVSTKNIEANRDKIKAITQLQPLQSRKDVQKLTGQIASLNQFIAQPSILHHTQKAFEDLKHYLEHLPTLSGLEQGQPLILYVSATHSAVNRALVVEKEIIKDGKITKQQFPMYFVSEVLTGSKKYYSKEKKIFYAVIRSSRKLCYYFEAHTMKVLTNHLLNDIFGNRDSSGRFSKWAMELSDYIVDFEKRSVIIGPS
jgi:polyhydroxyalkanoate synthesis regulator phasin